MVGFVSYELRTEIGVCNFKLQKLIQNLIEKKQHSKILFYSLCLHFIHVELKTLFMQKYRMSLSN